MPKPIVFEWDDGNKTKSFLKHNILQAEAEQAFFKRHFLKKDEAHSGFEDRFHIMGATNNGKILFISFTIRGNKIRIISARSADKYERKFYEKEVKENP